MGGFSLWHLLILAVVVLLLFGKGRFSAMMGDVAHGLKSFKKGMADEDEAAANQGKLTRDAPPHAGTVVDVSPPIAKAADEVPRS